MPTPGDHLVQRVHPDDVRVPNHINGPFPRQLIGLIGSRRRKSAKDCMLLTEAFERVYKPGDWIVSGGCDVGGDRFAELIAKEFGVPILIFYPRPQLEAEHVATRYYERNGWIASWSTIVLALVAQDRKGGTEDTIRKALRLGKEVWSITDWQSPIFSAFPASIRA